MLLSLALALYLMTLLTSLDVGLLVYVYVKPVEWDKWVLNELIPLQAVV